MIRTFTITVKTDDPDAADKVRRATEQIATQIDWSGLHTADIEAVERFDYTNPDYLCGYVLTPDHGGPFEPAEMLATFTPQAWVGDEAINVDCEGEASWIISQAYVDELKKWDDTDFLRYDPAAPEWIRLHRGPFYITVEPYETA